MEQLELVSVPVIAAIVYWTLYAVKCAVHSDKFNRFIPLLSAILGAVCGVVCFYAIPSVMPASNVCVALIIGAASGLTATGTHQMIKQLSNGNCIKSDDKSANASTQESDDEQSPPDEAATTKHETKQDEAK